MLATNSDFKKKKKFCQARYACGQVWPEGFQFADSGPEAEVSSTFEGGGSFPFAFSRGPETASRGGRPPSRRPGEGTEARGG